MKVYYDMIEDQLVCIGKTYPGPVTPIYTHKEAVLSYLNIEDILKHFEGTFEYLGEL